MTMLHLIKANPLERISNGKESISMYYFACNIIVVNTVNKPTSFGGGTIITARHVLTRAGLIAGYFFSFFKENFNQKETIQYLTFHLLFFSKGNTYRIDYRTPKLESIATSYAITHEDFDPQTLENDIALLFLLPTGNQFSVDKLLKLSDKSDVPNSWIKTSAVVVGHGYTSPTSMKISPPYYANLTMDGNQNTCGKIPQTLFCASGKSTAVLCQGDEGSGIFTHSNRYRNAVILV